MAFRLSPTLIKINVKFIIFFSCMLIHKKICCSKFIAGLLFLFEQYYLKKYAFDNAETSDLWNALGEVNISFWQSLQRCRVSTQSPVLFVVFIFSLSYITLNFAFNSSKCINYCKCLSTVNSRLTDTLLLRTPAIYYGQNPALQPAKAIEVWLTPTIADSHCCGLQTTSRGCLL